MSTRGKQRFISDVTSDPIAVPLVEICVKTVLCNGRILVGLSDFLPQSVDLLLGNDSIDKIDVNQTWVITRSQTSKPKTQMNYADDNEKDYTEDETGYDQHTMNDSLSNIMLDKLGSNETVNHDPENSEDVIIPTQLDNLDIGDTDYSIVHIFIFSETEISLSTVVSRSELIRLQNVDVN